MRLVEWVYGDVDVLRRASARVFPCFLIRARYTRVCRPLIPQPESLIETTDISTLAFNEGSPSDGCISRCCMALPRRRRRPSSNFGHESLPRSQRLLRWVHFVDIKRRQLLRVRSTIWAVLGIQSVVNHHTQWTHLLWRFDVHVSDNCGDPIDVRHFVPHPRHSWPRMAPGVLHCDEY